jgi:hypothetical protein
MQMFNNPLAQLVLTGNTPTTIYTINKNLGNFGQIDSVVFCNIGADTTVTYGVAMSGETINQDKQYLLYQHPLKANDTFIAKIGTALRAGDIAFGFTDPGANVAINVV